MAKTWKSSRAPAPSVEPSTITECARRYHACALALATSFGLPMTAAFLQEYHSAISCVYIEAGRTGVRLAAGVQLPPLAQASGIIVPLPNGSDHAEPVAVGTLVPAPNGDTPPLTVVPTDAGLPCGGQAISALKPAQLAMLISKTARLVQDDGGRWVPLLHTLEQERNARLARGRKPTPTPEGAADVP